MGAGLGAAGFTGVTGTAGLTGAALGVAGPDGVLPERRDIMDITDPPSGKGAGSGCIGPDDCGLGAGDSGPPAGAAFLEDGPEKISALALDIAFQSA